MSYSVEEEDMPIVGCTCHDSVTIEVPASGIIVVTSEVHIWIDEIPAGVPSDSLVNQAGTLISVYYAPNAGTYTYYLDIEMSLGESAGDIIKSSVTTAAYYGY